MRKQASSQAKNPALPGTAEHGLRWYSLAAAAASVSAMALLQPAEGEIIIKNKTIPIPANSGVLLDLNGDGVADFELFFSNYSLEQYSVNHFSMQPLGVSTPSKNQVIGRSYLASALLRGATIGLGGPFIHTFVDYGIPIEQSTLCTQNCGGKTGYSFDQVLRGKWGGGHPNRFIGVKFQINGKTHYGWIRMTITVKHKGTGKGPTGSFSVTITEYGYESVANKSCGAGLAGAAASDAVHTSEKPEQESARKTSPALGMLALGAEAMPLWRRED